MGDQCCTKTANGPNTSTSQTASQLPQHERNFLPYDPSQEPIFPSELQLNRELDERSLYFQGESVSWFRPVTLQELLTLKSQYPQARLVVGNSEVGVEIKFKNMKYPVLIAATHIAELNTIQSLDTGIRFGASVTLSQIDDYLKHVLHDLPEHKTRVYAAVVEILRWFAGHQIRNVACIGGNLMTASPISDLSPILLSARCVLTVASQNGGTRQIQMDENFFLGYRKTQVKPDEVLLYIDIPFTTEDEYFWAYKQAHRREDDIAIVNAGLKVKFKPGSKVIDDIALSFGGMAPITKMATKTMEALKGKSWDDQLMTEAAELLASEVYLAAGTPGGMESYRCTLTTSFFFKFYLTVSRQLQLKLPQLYTEGVPEREESATHVFTREASHGIQVYEEVVEGQDQHDPVGRPIVHRSADKQVTGEAVYIDDIPPYKNELYLGLVFSTKAHAKILDIDYSEALTMPGVQGHISHEDIPGIKHIGPIVHDEEFLASDSVIAQGQVICGIVADTQMHAQAAAKLVRVTYEEMEPIITIEQAIAEQSFLGPQRNIVKGDLDKAFASAKHIVEDEVKIGGQEHFYVETQVSLVVPTGEDGEMEIMCSTQDPTEAQLLVAEVLGVPSNKIQVRTKRLGGAFGGKESRFSLVLLPCVVAANKYQRPVRCMLDRDEDMICTGTRHPFLGKYKVAFNDDGKIEALDLILYSNAGCSTDLTNSVMESALFRNLKSYKVPNLRIRNFNCRTNTPSNTAFRGFGAPQGMFVSETDVAYTLGLQPEQVKRLNMIDEGDTTYFKQKLENCTIQRCWTEVMENVNLEERRQEVAKFNRENRWKKRGLSVVPTTYGIAFTSHFLNQAGALVHIYRDGSVLLTHGGTEMGQGLHTKMIQVASRALKIPLSKIHISETNTYRVPNTSPTAASASSDLYGMAVINACEKLMRRLEPFIKGNPNGTWEQWVSKAYFQRVSLSATGLYCTPDLHFDWKKVEGDVFNYFCYGASYSEVEIDCLTGDHNVLRTDIVMDVGRSLNPTIDIGQIEGAFMQGYGLFTLEEQRVSPSGFLYTKGPGAYKIPAFGDIPLQFNVALLKNASNPRAVYSSKAIGEPPLFLASSVFFAIKKAIKAARAETGLTGRFRLDSPATAEKIRMACQDNFTKLFPEPKPGTYTPWSIYL